MMLRNHNKTRPEGGFGVYIHWPFCKSKCPYCDFNSHVRHSPVDQKEFAAALVEELKYQNQFSSQFMVESIFFGGGTPSLMQAETVAYILEHIHKLWSVCDDVEISLEANPTSVEADNFKAYSAAGVNRVSLGVQSLRDKDLQFLGRQHSAREALEALEVARSEFSRVSVDMIYTRPGQTPEAWEQELADLLAHDLDHLSLYQLTIEPQTPFEQLYKAGKIRMPEEGPARKLFEINQELCEKAGLRRYEVSNHAKNDAQCRHNLIYWKSGYYAGVGPGAHARLIDDIGRFSLIMEKHPETWLNSAFSKGQGISVREELSLNEIGDEFLIMGLRLAEGISLDRYERISGGKLNCDHVSFLESEGLVCHNKEENILKASDKGLPVLNKIIETLSRS